MTRFRPVAALALALAVAAPLGADSGLEVRRHWHTHCWGRS